MWIKICGIKDIETASAVVARGADAIGLNFYKPSKRCVDVATAGKISAEFNDQAELIGLFVNHALDEILETCESTGLSSIQLHGDETPAFIAELQNRNPQLRCYRAFRVDRATISESISAYLSQCDELGVELVGCLVDSFIPGEYGGTGHTAPWDLLAEHYDSEAWPRLIVAGGLTPKNVAEAIRVTTASGVDVASGVESEPGTKDLELVQEFIRSARQAR
jgi:phosphoribosylanthranilate isomerase